MLPKLCHLDNDLLVIIIIQYILYLYYILRSTHDLHTVPYLGTFFFSRHLPLKSANVT